MCFNSKNLSCVECTNSSSKLLFEYKNIIDLEIVCNGPHTILRREKPVFTSDSYLVFPGIFHDTIEIELL